jgi:hypothetical protein
VMREYQTQGVKNVVLLDGSGFVASMRQRPAATSQVLAVWAAELMGGKANGRSLERGKDEIVD